MRPLILVLGCLVALGCRRGPVGREEAPAPPRARRAPPRARRRRPSLERRASFAFARAPLPEVLSRLAAQCEVQVSVAGSIPVEEWSTCRVTLRMADVTVRDFLDWLARQLAAEYAIDGEGSVWLTRGDDLLLVEPLEVRAYRVPTHFASRVPVAGVLDFAQEQKLVLSTLESCLRYLLVRRPGCRLAFHGQDDVLAARLTARGHQRLEAVLDAMRHGTAPRPEPRPSTAEIQASLRKPVLCDWPQGPPELVLARLAERAGVNLAWDPLPVAGATVELPRGTHALVNVLDRVFRQTPLGRYRVEAGRGVWLYADGQRVDYPRSRATIWDRSRVQAYEVGTLLRTRPASGLVAELQRQVDPGKWVRGLPAASVFAPTGRLIVVHDEEGQERVAQVVRGMLSGAVAVPSESDGRK